MKTASHTITTATTFSSVSLDAAEVENAAQSAPGDTAAALVNATRAGLFSPVTAGPADHVAAAVNPDGSAEIVVVATVTTIGPTAGSAN